MTLDATGLTIKTAAEIESEIDADLRAAIGDQLVIAEDSPLGKTRSIFAAKLAEVWTLMAQVYESLDPDSAVGDELENICALAPITRRPATKSTTRLRVFGVDTTFIPIGYIARIPNGAQWLTTESGTIAGGRVDLDIEAEFTGPVEAEANTITEPVTIIAGVTSVDNLSFFDFTLGSDIETDVELRQRREASLSVSGSATDQAIAARLLDEIDTIEQALVISNRTDDTDALGIPPHTARPIVWPTQTDDEAVWTVLWDHMPASISTDGTEAGTVPDSEGGLQHVAYSVASEQEIHVEIVLTIDSLTYGGDDAVKAAVVAARENAQIGEDLLLWTLENRVTDDVTGILTIEARAKIGSAPSASDTNNLTIERDGIGTIILANVDVTTS